VFCVAASGIACSQTNGPTGLSVRLGIFLPTSDFARSIGNSWFTGGIDYKLNSVAVTPMSGTTSSYLSLSADYYEKSPLRAIPVAINYNVRTSQIVWSVGIGVDFDRVGTDSTGIGGQVGVAYEFGPSPTPFFIQAKYFLDAKSDLDGFGIYAGVRF